MVLVVLLRFETKGVTDAWVSLFDVETAETSKLYFFGETAVETMGMTYT